MLVDVTAFLQGAIDSQQAGEITADELLTFSRLVHDISHVGISSRRVCDYTKLLGVLGKLRARSFTMSQLWRRLGPSLASGIGVASNCENEQLFA